MDQRHYKALKEALNSTLKNSESTAKCYYKNNSVFTGFKPKRGLKTLKYFFINLKFL